MCSDNLRIEKFPYFFVLCFVFSYWTQKQKGFMIGSCESRHLIKVKVQNLKLWRKRVAGYQKTWVEVERRATGNMMGTGERSSKEWLKAVVFVLGRLGGKS